MERWLPFSEILYGLQGDDGIYVAVGCQRTLAARICRTYLVPVILVQVSLDDYLDALYVFHAALEYSDSVPSSVGMMDQIKLVRGIEDEWLEQRNQGRINSRKEKPYISYIRSIVFRNVNIYEILREERSRHLLLANDRSVLPGARRIIEAGPGDFENTAAT